MQKSRLVEVFLALSKAERRELGKYVQSPVFNQRQDVTDLYDYLYRNFPFDKAGSLDRAVVFPAVFPGEKFDPAKLDYIVSFLFNVLKAYLIRQEQLADPVYEQLLLTRSLRKRNLGRQFEREFKIAEKALADDPIRDADHHFNGYLLQFEQISFSKTESRNLAASFQEFAGELTTFFIAKKLWQACSAVMHQTVWKTDLLGLDLLEPVLRHVEQNDYSQVPAVNLYFHCYKALTEVDSLRWFERLRELIREHHHRFPQAEVIDLYLVPINYCIRRFNQGEREFLEEAFKLYREGLETGAFLEGGSLSRFTYNNIVMAGLLLKEFDWVEGFLHRYREHIEPKFRDSTFSYNLAIFYYQKQDHEQAMTLLQQADFDDVMHNLSARRMLLKIYFEREESEALNSLITSFKNFIYRQKELGSVARDSYLNLLKFTKKMMSLNRRDRAAKAALRAEVEATEPLAEKGWILEVLG